MPESLSIPTRAHLYLLTQSLLSCLWSLESRADPHGTCLQFEPYTSCHWNLVNFWVQSSPYRIHLYQSSPSSFRSSAAKAEWTLESIILHPSCGTIPAGIGGIDGFRMLPSGVLSCSRIKVDMRFILNTRSYRSQGSPTRLAPLAIILIHAD
jgi:hypothetical protein